MTFTFFGCAFQRILLRYTIHVTVHYPVGISTRGLASFAFARHYSRNLGWFLFLRLLRCFSSAGSLRYTMYSCMGHVLHEVSPFGNLRILRLFAPPRSLSQLVTSFIGSQCQGILHMLFFAWTTFVYWSQYTLGSLYAWIAVFSYLQFKDIFYHAFFGKIVSFYPITEKPDFVFNDFF